MEIGSRTFETQILWWRGLPSHCCHICTQKPSSWLRSVNLPYGTLRCHDLSFHSVIFDKIRLDIPAKTKIMDNEATRPIDFCSLFLQTQCDNVTPSKRGNDRISQVQVNFSASDGRKVAKVHRTVAKLLNASIDHKVVSVSDCHNVIDESDSRKVISESDSREVLSALDNRKSVSALDSHKVV